MISLWGLFGGASNNNNASAHASSPSNNGRGGVGTSSSSSSQSALLRAAFGESLDALMIEATRHKDGSLLRECIFAAQSRPLLDAHDVFHALMVSCEELRRHKSSRPLLLRSLSDVCKLISLNLMPLDAQDIHAACNVVRRLAWCVESTTPTPSSSSCVGTQQQQQQTKQKQTLSLSGTSTPPPAPPSSSSTSSTTPTPTTTHAAALRCNDGLRVSLIANDDGILTRCVQLIVSLVSACSVEHVAYGELVGVLMIVFAASPAHSMAEATCAAAMCQQTHVLCAALRDYTGDEDGRGGVPSSTTTNNNNSSLTRQTCVSSYVKDLCAIIAGEEPSRISLMIPRMAEHNNNNNNNNIKSASPTTTTTTTLARGLGTGPLSTPQRLAAAHASELNSTTAAWVLPGVTPRDELHNTSMAATTTTTCADGVKYQPNFRLRRHLLHCLVLFFSEPRTQGRRGADDVGVDERVCAHLINPILLRCIDTCIIGLALKTPEELAGSPSSSSSSTSLAASPSATHVVASSSNNNNNDACSFLSPSEAAEMFSQTQRLAALVAEHYAANMRGAITRWIHFHHRLTQQQQQQQQQQHTTHVSEEMHHRPFTSSCVVAMIAAAWAPVVAKPHVLNELLAIKTTRPFTLQHDDDDHDHDHDDEVMDEEDVVVMVLAMKMMQLLTNGDAYTPEDDERPTIKQTTTTSSSSLMLVDQQRLDVLEFIEQFGRGLVEVLAKLPRGISRDDFAQHLSRVDACMQHLINAHLEATTSSSSSSSTYCMTGDDEVYRARLLHADAHYLRASMLLQLPSMHAHIDVYVRTLMVPPVEMFAPLLLSTPTHTSSTSPTTTTTTTQAEGMMKDDMSAAPTTTTFTSGDGVAARATRITQQAVQRFTSTFARKPLNHEEGGSATPTSSTTFTGVVATTTTTTSVNVLDASRRMYAIGRAASTLRLHISMCSILLRTCLCCGHEQQQQQQKQRQRGWTRLVRGLLQVDLIDARVNWLMKYAAAHQRAMKKSGTNNNNNNNRRDDVGVDDVAASWVKLDGVLRDAHEAAQQLTTDWWSFCVNGAEDGCIDAMECMWGEMVQEMKKIPSHTHTDGAPTTTSTPMDDDDGVGDDDDDDAHVAAYFSAMCACEVSRRCTWMSQSLVLALLAALTSTAPVAGRVWASWRHLAHHTSWHLHHPTIKNNTQTSTRATTKVMMSSTRRAPPSSLPAALREALTLDPLEARRRSTTNMLAMIASLATLFTRAMASHRAREDAVSVDDLDDARHQPTSSTLMASAFADTDVMKRWMSFTGSQRRFPAAALDDVLHQLCSAPCELMMQAQHEALRLWGGNDEDEDEEELATVNLDDDDQDHLEEVLHDKHHSVAAHTTYTNTAIIVHQRLDISAQLIQHVFELIQSCGGEVRNQCWLFLLRLLRDAAVEMPIFLQRLTHKQHDDDDGNDDLHLADGEVERLCNRAMDALTLAFRAVEATHHNCITHLDVHTLRELMMAIGAFVRLPTPTPTMESRTFINLTAVQMLWAMADYVALSRRTKQHNNNNNLHVDDDGDDDDDDGDDDVLMAHESTTIPLSDDDVLWCTLMIQLQDGSMDVRQEVRQSSLSSLFAITQAHGAHFSAECWSCLLLGVFVELMEATMAAVEASSSSSLTTTTEQAFTNTTTTNTSTKRLASPHPPPSSSHTNVSSMDETSVARRDFLRAITLAPRKELEEMRIAIMDGIARCIIHHMDDMRRGLRSVEHIKENTSDVDDDDGDDDDEDLLTEMLLLLVDVCGQTRVVLKGGSAEKCALAAVYALYGLMHEVDVLPPRVRQRAWAVMELLVQESITDDDADASTRRGTTTSTSPATMAVVAAIVAALSSDYVGRLRIAGEPAMEDLSAAILAASRTHPLHDEHKLDHDDGASDVVVVVDDDDDACIDGASLATYQRYVGLLRMCMRCPAVLQSFYFPNRVQVAMADGLRDVCERLAPRAAQHTLRTLMSLQFPSKQHNTSTSREEESEWRPGAGPSVLVMWLNLLRTLMMDGVQADDDVGTHAKKKKKHQQRHVEMQELLLADAVELITRVLLVGFTTTSLSAEVSSDCTDILHEILAHVMSDAVNDADDDDATSTRASAAGIRRVDAAIEAVQRSAEDLLHASTAALRRQRSEPEYQHDDDDDAPPSSSQKRTSLAVAMEEFGCVMDGLRELLLWRKQHTHDEDVAQHHHHRHHHPSWKEVLASSTQLLQRILHETSHAGIEAVELRDRCRSILRACDVDAHTTASASSSTMDHRVVLLEDLIHNYRERIDDASTHAALLEYITELEDDLVELSPSLRWELVERLLPLMSGGATSEVARSADGLAREHMMKQEVEKTLRMIHSYLRT